MIRRAALPALALLVVGNFVGHAIAGHNGVLAWGGYRRSWRARRPSWPQLEAERDAAAPRSALLDPRKADPDLAEEMVRQGLGLVRPDEVIIPLE